MAKQFKCNVCGYIHEGDAAPEKCPVCNVPATEFTEIVAPKKSWWKNTDSNVYIIVYAVVMVVIVATMLALAALGLKERQEANQLNEKKMSILSALYAGEAAQQDVPALELIEKNGIKYDEVIEAYVVDAEGKRVDGDVFALLNDLKSAFTDGKFPIFEAKDGRMVVPVTGGGLWGPVWGYVALEKDMSTVAGIVLDHSGETPGLGAEIATPKFQKQFVGKSMFEGEEFVSVKIVKGGLKKPAHEVDAISGGTKTSEGVSAAINDSFVNYLPLLKSKRQAVAAPAVEQVEAEAVESNVENVENNE